MSRVLHQSAVAAAGHAPSMSHQLAMTHAAMTHQFGPASASLSSANTVSGHLAQTGQPLHQVMGAGSTTTSGLLGEPRPLVAVDQQRRYNRQRNRKSKTQLRDYLQVRQASAGVLYAIRSYKLYQYNTR